MTEANLAACHAQLAAKCAELEKARLAGLSHTQNIAGLTAADIEALTGEYAAAAVADAARFRAQYAATVTDESARAALTPVLRNYGLAINSPHTDPSRILDDLHKYFDAQAVAAQGTLTLDTEPADGDTMTIGAVTYRFKTTTAAAEDIKRGDGLAAVQARIVQVINGDGGTPGGTDFHNGTTTPHPTVKCAQAFASDDLVLTARVKGTAGDALATTETFTAGTNVFDDTTLGATTAGVAPITVKTRAFSFDTVAAGASNGGNGTIVRCTVDERGYDIEAGWADTVTIECTAAAGQGANKHEEQFEIRGKATGIDRLSERGSGLVTPLQALSSRASRRLLRNESFDTLTPATDGQDVTAGLNGTTGWITSDGTLTNLKVASAAGRYYRAAVGVSSPKALDLRASRRIYQVLKPAIDYSRPYVLQIAYLPENSGAGILAARLRSYTTPASRGPILAMNNVAISGTTWQTLRLIAWPRVWAAGSDIALEIEWARTNGNLVIDEVVFAPLTEHDSLYYGAMGGDEPFQVDDVFDFGDAATGSINQRWIHRGFRQHLPHAASPSVAEPTVT